MKTYKAVRNNVMDREGNQIAVVLPVNCTKKDARQMAVFAAEQMNIIERNRARKPATFEVYEK